MQKIKWDWDALEEYLTKMNDAWQVLYDNSEFIKNLNEEVNAAWKGVAGTAFDGVLKVDYENYKDLWCDLAFFTSDVCIAQMKYEDCEEEIRGKIAALKSKIG